MRIEENPRLETPPQDWDSAWMQRHVAALEKLLATLSRDINGQLGFGDGTDIDNLIGKWMTYGTNAVANTEDTLVHNLGAVPIGFLVLKPPTSGFIYTGGTPWTSSNVYLKCSQAGQSSLIFLLLSSAGITV